MRRRGDAPRRRSGSGSCRLARLLAGVEAAMAAKRRGMSFAVIRACLNCGDHLLLGYNLQRTPGVHLATYPADQTLGILHNASLNELRRELDADIGTGALAVEVTLDEDDGAVNGWLVSTRDHVLKIGRGARRRAFSMTAGHNLRVLLPHKCTLDGMAASAAKRGFEIQKTWTDASGWIADSVFRAM